MNVYHRRSGSRNSRSHFERWLILSHYEFSPAKDLARDEQSGVVYLTNKRRFDLELGARRIEAIQRGVVNYFLSRDEDNQRMVMMRQMARMGGYGHGAVAAAPRRHRSASPNAMMRIPRQIVAPRRAYLQGFY
ncbi:unnamed protein product [Adineta ricciae]|nr:unnamed protein product [Adineta ricciae]